MHFCCLAIGVVYCETFIMANKINYVCMTKRSDRPPTWTLKWLRTCHNFPTQGVLFQIAPLPILVLALLVMRSSGCLLKGKEIDYTIVITFIYAELKLDLKV